MKVDLVIRYLGFGKRCSGCGRVRETTRYVLKNGEDLLKEFLLCDACQDRGFIVSFDVKSPTEAASAKRRRVKISRKLEREVAHDIGGKVQPGSGNQDAKADIRKVDEWRIEHKYTDSKAGFRLEVQSLAAVISHANLAGEWPAMVINFRKLARKFAVIPYELFLEIVENLSG